MDQGIVPTRSSKKQETLVKTSKVLYDIKKMTLAGKGAPSRKPSVKLMGKLKKILTVLESGHMPFPDTSILPNGCVILSWVSPTKDISMLIDAAGAVQLTTSVKKINTITAEVMDRVDAEGYVTDLISVDYIMAWYCSDIAHAV